MLPLNPASEQEFARVDILIKGLRLPTEAALDIRAVSVHDDLAAASMFMIELHNWDSEQQRFTWSDDRRFEVGSEVTIRIGYGSLTDVMVGEITSLEPAFAGESTSTLIVRGYDHRHRLLRGRKTRSFTNMTDSAIAQQIALATGLTSKVTDTKVTLEYVLQHNQTDLAFLQERARLIGYEVFVREKELFFRPPAYGAQPDTTLKLGQDLIEFYPRLSTMAQVSEVEVRGWDFKNKALFSGKATVHSEVTLGGTHSGAGVASSAFGTASLPRVDQPVFTVDEATRMARGQFTQIALAYISGEGLCYGKPQLRAGTMVYIGGVGNSFSGNYYVTSATHSLSSNLSYRTRFTVQRTA